MEKVRVLLRPALAWLLLLLPASLAALLAVDYLPVFLPRLFSSLGMVLLAWGAAVALQYRARLCRIAVTAILGFCFGFGLLELFSFALGGRGFDLDSLVLFSPAVWRERLPQPGLILAGALLILAAATAAFFFLSSPTPKVRRRFRAVAAALAGGGLLLLLLFPSAFSGLAVLYAPGRRAIPAPDRERLAAYGIKPTLLTRDQVRARPRPGHNLILIFLHDFEDSYLYQQDFPGLLPNIFRRLTTESIYFSNLRPLRLAGGVRGREGVFAALNGFFVPPALAGESRLGDALSSLPHILGKAGYEQAAFLAQRPDFEAAREFRDYNFVLERPGAASGEIFDLGLSLARELAAAPALFHLTLLIDPAPAFAAEDGATTRKQKRLAALHRVDGELENFLGELAQLPGYDNIRIAVVAPHLAPENPREAPEAERKLIFFILNVEGPGQFDMPARSFDIAPTVLNILGLEYDYVFPLGENLFYRTDPRRLDSDSGAGQAALADYLRFKCDR